MSSTRTEYLQDILASTRKHYDIYDLSHLTVPSTSPPTSSISPLSLGGPTAEFKTKLQKSGISPSITSAALESASQIAAHYQESYTKYCKQLLSGPAGMESDEEAMNRLRRTYEHLFVNKNLVDIFSTASDAQVAINAKLNGQRRSPPVLERQPFNHNFTPFLEAYFEQNAYPSHADQKALAEKSNMGHAKIVNWFQNHRNRLRSAGKESDIKRLPPGQAVNLELIEERIRAASNEHDQEDVSSNDGASDDDAPAHRIHLNLDCLARSSAETVSNSYIVKSAEPCASTSEAFGLPTPARSPPSTIQRSSSPTRSLDAMFSDINILVASSPKGSSSKTNASKVKAIHSRASTPKAPTRTHSFKASLRSCFSAAITLTCPRSHPALIRRRKNHTTPVSIGKFTILERKHVPVQPYSLPAILPSWELPATPDPEPVIRRKKPTIASHAGKTRPGSPYPKQTISRMSSTSSLASMASDDSQSSSRSTSSTFSSSTVESSELDTPAQSPSPDNAELIDDVRFSDDIFGDYFFHSNPISDNFFFDINVEQPFDKDVSLSVAEFDKSVSLSIAEFETTTLPSFDFFES
ncbi:hypothetical protein D9619_002865 [Psilocybe cf. subviscida]|uniref:Homeobox domain-containing protein n=1 Tax=Psilocybe cf. subviscida TaxID=2480587 RepID=A0A8H5AX95_9AGAR|nr:hypothetical protein D9619_002865 [Psilocybe cf. subviscida]